MRRVVSDMKLSTVEKCLIVSPIATNLILSYACLQLDIYLDAYTMYWGIALLILTFFPIVAGVILRTKLSLTLYLLVHIVTALLAIYLIYNDSALIYLYVSLILFIMTVCVSMVIRKIISKSKSLSPKKTP